MQKTIFHWQSVPTPRFPNIDYWFKREVQQQLTRLKAAIETVDDEEARAFCFVVFSRVVREASNTRQNEFKLFRLPLEKLKHHSPDVFALFRERFWECAQLVGEWLCQANGKLVKPKLPLHDTRQPSPVEPESVDLVLTSPHVKGGIEMTMLEERIIILRKEHKSHAPTKEQLRLLERRSVYR